MPGPREMRKGSILMDIRFAKRTELMNSSVVRETLKLTARPDIISFAGGMPAPEVFPVEAMRAASDKVLTTAGPTALQYGPLTAAFPCGRRLQAATAGRVWPAGRRIS